MRTSVQRWGNSLALRIPKTYAEETHILAGSEVELTLKSGSLIIRPVSKRSLKDLVDAITPANLHDCVSTGASVGQEVW
jgi:antitoxin MazE